VSDAMVILSVLIKTKKVVIESGARGLASLAFVLYIIVADLSWYIYFEETHPSFCSVSKNAQRVV
jgi:hypothetical protein